MIVVSSTEEEEDAHAKLALGNAASSRPVIRPVCLMRFPGRQRLTHACAPCMSVCLSRMYFGGLQHFIGRQMECRTNQFLGLSSKLSKDVTLTFQIKPA